MLYINFLNYKTLGNKTHLYIKQFQLPASFDAVLEKKKDS